MFKYLNLNFLKEDGYGGIEFIAENESMNGWFICFSRIENKVYSGHLGLNFEISQLNGNLIILSQDNYVEEPFVLLTEESESSNICVFWKKRDDLEFNNLICQLNSNLEVIRYGSDPDGKSIKLDQERFENIQSLIKKIDKFFFYAWFKTF